MRPLGCAAGVALRQLADVVDEDRLLRGGEVLGVLGDLGEERISGQDGGLVLVAARGVAEQGGDIDLERAGKAVERRERGHRLAILDLRDVGARDAHAAGKLALREVADVAEVADSGSYLDFSGTSLGRGFRDESDGGLGLDLLRQQGLLAAAAGLGRGAELHELAVVAPQDLAVRGCHRARSHSLRL
jgi:hypothetical protein